MYQCICSLWGKVLLLNVVQHVSLHSFARLYWWPGVVFVFHSLVSVPQSGVRVVTCVPMSTSNTTLRKNMSCLSTFVCCAASYTLFIIPIKHWYVWFAVVPMLSSYSRGAAHGEANDRPRQKEAAASRCAALSVRSFVRASGFSHPGRTTGCVQNWPRLSACLLGLLSLDCPPYLTQDARLNYTHWIGRNDYASTFCFVADTSFLQSFPRFRWGLERPFFSSTPYPLPFIVCFCQSFSLANPL